jgi:glycosyltransferase involved in cell wall biosynthesis
LLSANSAWNVVNFRLGLCRALIGEGYDVVVAAPADGHESGLADEQVRFVPLQVDRSGMNPVTDLQLLGRYRQLMRDLRPAAFLGFTIKPNVYGSLAARAAGVPSINNISGLGTMFLGKGWQSLLAHRLYRLALRRSPTVLFQNPDDRQLFVEAGTVRSEQAKVIPGSGIDLARFTPAPVAADMPPTFLFIGRLLADKGVREFVEAARLVRQELPSAKFEMLGETDPGNRTTILPEEIDRWRRTGNVHLLGETVDVRPYISRSTAVVLPSYREGLPRVLLEAAAMARPLIASDVPGCRSIVEHERNGLLCMVRDAGSLADAIFRMIRLPREERAAMGQAARATVEAKFSEQQVIQAYLAALRDIGARSGVGQA